MTDPVKGLRLAYAPVGDVSQWFGENKALYARFDLNGHNGIDIVRKWGERIYAVEDGIIAEVKEDAGGYGRHVRMWSKDLTREWTYGHLSSEIVSVGQEVKEGQIIATMGNTGFVVSGDTQFWPKGANITTGTSHPGTHLHFGLRLIKPDKKGWRYSNKTPLISVLNVGNGFKGSVNPVDYLRDPKLLSTRVERVGTKVALIVAENLRLIGK